MLDRVSVTAGVEQQYEALISGCGLLDRSERGKLALSGEGAKEFLQGQVSNDVLALTPGSGCYAAFLTVKGKMLGDLRILDTGEELLLDTERVALQELFNLIRRFSVGYPVELHKRTLQRGLVSLIGPSAGELVPEFTAPGAEHAHAKVAVEGIPARAIRTDLGVDLLVEAERTAELTAALQARGALEVEEAAAEIVRVERGRPRYGIDLDDSVIPQEAGLNDRAVSFTKGCYVGQETVARLFYRGKPNRSLRGLRLEEPAQRGEEIHAGDRVAGVLSSTVTSPRLGHLALALVRREVADGARVTIGESGIGARVVALPFSG